MEAFILAGGQSRRFGENKALFKLNGKRVIERIVETARAVCPDVYVVVKDKKAFESLKLPLVEDLYSVQSPIVGIYTALEVSRGGNVLILSADIPLIKRDVLRILMDSYREPVTVFKIGDRVHPLIGIYSKTLKGTLKEYIESGHRSVMGFLERTGFNAIEQEAVMRVDPELDSFLNMNTKEDLKELMEKTGWT